MLKKAVRNKQELLTAETARKLYAYDPLTGILTYRRMRIGSRVGTLKRNSLGREFWEIHFSHKRFAAHRVIWLIQTGSWPKNFIDHKNGNPLDNRWENLREATHAQNMQNGMPKGGLLKGVTKIGSKYRAQIRRRHLGMFDTELAAHEAYMAEARRQYGEFARAA